VTRTLRTKVMMAVGLAALTLALSACGEKKESVTSSVGPQSMKLMLDWFPNADHVGIYQAVAAGDFEKAGLDVHIQVPSDPSQPLQMLAAGKTDIAISYEPEVMLARNKGEPLVSVAAIVQKPLTSIVSIGSRHINSPAELRGKRVGDAGIPYQHAFLTTILSHAHVPAGSVKETNVGSDLVPAMLSRRVAATLGSYWNYEAIQLQRMHKHPNVIRMDQVGVPTYDELVVVARKATVVNHPDEVRRFVQALGRGYEAVRRNPQAAVDNLVKANPGLNPSFEFASVKATLPDFFPSNSSNPWGWQSASQWNAFGQWMLDQHLISNPNAVADASTNELLAGQGL
jgi:putative hydroxymethylpyrimidine transport system substrate-binding protein